MNYCSGKVCLLGVCSNDSRVILVGNTLLGLCLLCFSCAEPNHCFLVQRQGTGNGIRNHPSLLSAWKCTELSAHCKLCRCIWADLDAVGRFGLSYMAFLSVLELLLLTCKTRDAIFRSDMLGLKDTKRID